LRSPSSCLRPPLTCQSLLLRIGVFPSTPLNRSLGPPKPLQNPLEPDLQNQGTTGVSGIQIISACDCKVDFRLVEVDVAAVLISLGSSSTRGEVNSL
jgi:hypothetical protein